MLTAWYETDSDCAQYMRKDESNSHYEMIQAVWLDTTDEDRAKGLHEYVVCCADIYLDDYLEEEKEAYISSYGYTMESLTSIYSDGANDIIAECILEDVLLNDLYVIADKADSLEEAREFIKKYIKEN